MSCIKWTPESVTDLQRLFEFLQQKSPEAARLAARQILETANNLLIHPRLGKLRADTSYRELPTAFGKRGYIIRYALDDGDTPVIIRVWHYLEDKAE